MDSIFNEAPSVFEDTFYHKYQAGLAVNSFLVYNSVILLFVSILEYVAIISRVVPSFLVASAGRITVDELYYKRKSGVNLDHFLTVLELVTFTALIVFLFFCVVHLVSFLRKVLVWSLRNPVCAILLIIKQTLCILYRFRLFGFLFQLVKGIFLVFYRGVFLVVCLIIKYTNCIGFSLLLVLCVVHCLYGNVIKEFLVSTGLFICNTNDEVLPSYHNYDKIVTPLRSLATMSLVIVPQSSYNNVFINCFLACILVFFTFGCELFCLFPLTFMFIISGGGKSLEHADKIIRSPSLQETKKGRNKRGGHGRFVGRVLVNKNAQHYAGVKTIDELQDEMYSYRPFDIDDDDGAAYGQDWADEDAEDYDFFNDLNVTQEDKQAYTQRVHRAFALAKANARFSKWAERKRGRQEAKYQAVQESRCEKDQILLRYALSIMNTWYTLFSVPYNEDFGAFYCSILSVYGIARIEDIRFSPPVFVPVSDNTIVPVSCYEDFDDVRDHYMRIANELYSRKREVKGKKKSDIPKGVTTSVICGPIDSPHTVLIDGTVQEGQIITDTNCASNSLNPVKTVEVKYVPFSSFMESLVWANEGESHGAYSFDLKTELKVIDDNGIDDNDALDYIYEKGFRNHDGSSFETMTQVTLAVSRGNWINIESSQQCLEGLSFKHSLLKIGYMYINEVSNMVITCINGIVKATCECSRCSLVKDSSEFTTKVDYSTHKFSCGETEVSYYESKWRSMCRDCVSIMLDESRVDSSVVKCPTCKKDVDKDQFSKNGKTFVSCYACRCAYVKRMTRENQQNVVREVFYPLRKDNPIISALDLIRFPNAQERNAYLDYVMYIKKVKSDFREKLVQEISNMTNDGDLHRKIAAIVCTHMKSISAEELERCKNVYRKLKEEADIKLRNSVLFSSGSIVTTTTYADVVRNDTEAKQESVKSHLKKEKKPQKPARSKGKEPETASLIINESVQVELDVDREQETSVQAVSLAAKSKFQAISSFLGIGDHPSGSGLIASSDVSVQTECEQQTVNYYDAIKELTACVMALRDDNVVLRELISGIAVSKTKAKTSNHQSTSTDCPMRNFSMNTDKTITKAVSVGTDKDDVIEAVVAPLRGSDRRNKSKKKTTVKVSEQESAFGTFVSKAEIVNKDCCNLCFKPTGVSNQEALISHTELPRVQDLRLHIRIGSSDVYTFNAVCTAVTPIVSHVLLTIMTVNHVNSSKLSGVSFIEGENNKKVAILSLSSSTRVFDAIRKEGLLVGTRFEENNVYLDDAETFNITSNLNYQNTPCYNPTMGCFVLAIPCLTGVASTKCASLINELIIPSSRFNPELLRVGTKIVTIGRGINSQRIGVGNVVSFNEFGPDLIVLHHNASVADETGRGTGMSGSLVLAYSDLSKTYVPFGLHYGVQKGNNVAYSLTNCTIKQTSELNKFISSYNK